MKNMKKTIGIMAMGATAVIALQSGISCSKAENDTADFNDGKYTLTINLDRAHGQVFTTKAELVESKETKINNVQIFVFNEDGKLDSYHAGTESKQIKIRCSSGKKKVISIVNAPSLSTCTDTTTLLGKTTSLSDNRIGNFVMTGRASATLPDDASVNVKVSRITARVGIKNISANFTSDGYKQLTFTINSIYMINVAGSTDYALSAPQTWINQAGLEDGERELDALLYTSINHSLSEETPMKANQYFYVYPNPATVDNTGTPLNTQFTKLVVEATLGDKTCYYSIKLPNIERNKAYTLSSLTLTRPGTDSADEEITSEECTFSIEVEDWISVAEQDLVI